MKFLQKLFFRSRANLDLGCAMRRFWWRMQGARFGYGTRVPQLKMSWPHQVSIGDNCSLEPDIFFKFDGIWQPGPSIIIGNRSFIGCGCEFNIRQSIEIGQDALIASGCKFIDHDHGMDVGVTMNKQTGAEAEIVLENDVWLGVNVVVLKGVRIGSGAVVAAGAVVTRSVGAGEIWGGVPARKISERLPPTIQGQKQI